MQNKKLELRWIHRELNRDEWIIIEAAWDQLLEEKKVKIGEESDIATNFNCLLKRMKNIDDGFERNM